MADASWQSEQMNPATTTGPAIPVSTHLGIIDTTT
jgi:hypothetical protein